MKLKAKEKKLLTYLYHHYREPLTKIGKACRISRDQVEYALEKYKKTGIIKKYLTIFNYSMLGYSEFVIVWLKLSRNNKEKIKAKLEKMRNVISVGEVLNNYDLFVNFIFKNKEDFENEFSNFTEQNKKDIKDHTTFIITFSELFPLKIFGSIKKETNYIFIDKENKTKITEKDLEIMKILEQNGRSRIIDIAEQTNLSSELVVYRLKQLNKKGLILGTRIQFDMEKLGFHFATLRIKLGVKNKDIKKKIKLFCNNHKNINLLAFGISEYNCLIQFFYQKEEELRKVIRDVNEFLKENTLDSELLLIEKEGRVRTLPL